MYHLRHLSFLCEMLSLAILKYTIHQSTIAILLFLQILFDNSLKLNTNYYENQNSLPCYIPKRCKKKMGAT